ncbi:MAG: cation:proton antiporter [Gammaproteobacteria bacterium]|nr:cation:proton antiporter [Gammaproteobacteria bacterium]
MGCIASATAPAATLDVVIESKDKTPFSNLLISIVALDDAWALMLFGIGVATSISGHVSDSSSIFLATKVKPDEPILTEALGLIFICGGLAQWLDVSFLIASIVMGAVVASFAKHHDYPFHEIENIEWQFMVIFFVSAGAKIGGQFSRAISKLVISK